MEKQLNLNHKLLDINYEHLNYQELIKFKTESMSLIRRLNNIRDADDIEGYTNQFKHFVVVTHGAYGYLKNPYIKVMSSIRDLETDLGVINANIPEHWIMDMVEFVNNHKQIFNMCSLINSENIDEFIKKVNNFDNAINLYNYAYENRDSIYRKYLGFEEGNFDDKYYRVKDVSSDYEYCVIVPEGKNLHADIYSFEHWTLWKSTFTYTDKNGTHQDIFEITHPQYFV